ncbi:MAG: dihydrofolate reductase family protein [Alphaproteobacteria bacterium]|nr:dihydrofolate reductase family protein [Alphaproteobacteria bacterium]
MRDLAILTFLTLDGVMQGPSSPDEDPSDGFTQGGWAADYWEEVMAQVYQEAMGEPYDIVFGRRTYDLFANHWPDENHDNPVSSRLNTARKYVATSTPLESTWQNSEPLAGDVIAAIADLKSLPGPMLQIHGSGALIQSLLAHDLIDEFRLWTFPVVVGSGRRLFGPQTSTLALSLKKSVPCANGAVMTIYRRDRTEKDANHLTR